MKADINKFVNIFFSDNEITVDQIKYENFF